MLHIWTIEQDPDNPLNCVIMPLNWAIQGHIELAKYEPTGRCPWKLVYFGSLKQCEEVSNGLGRIWYNEYH